MTDKKATDDAFDQGAILVLAEASQYLDSRQLDQIVSAVGIYNWGMADQFDLDRLVKAGVDEAVKYCESIATKRDAKRTED